MTPYDLFDELIDSGNLSTDWSRDFMLTEIFEVTKIAVQAGNAGRTGRAYKTLTVTLTKPDGEKKEIAFTFWSRNNGPQGRIDLKTKERRTK